MNNFNLLIGIAIVICLCIAVFAFLHKRNRRFREEGIKETIDKIFAITETKALSRKDFVYGLQERYKCSHKEALYLLGVAIEQKMISIDDKNVYLHD